jgi:hypothetical protein
MRLRITNNPTPTVDVLSFSFEFAGALEIVNEYSGFAVHRLAILPSQSSSKARLT